MKNPVFFNSYNCFSILSEEYPFLLTLSLLSASYRKHSHYFLSCQSTLRSIFKIFHFVVFSSSSPLLDSDLGSKDPLTLPIIVNNSLSAFLLMDSGPSSQFIDMQYAERMNLEMNLKSKAQDLILADRKPSPIGKITHTCTLKLTIDQYRENLTFQVTKLASWDLIVRKP